MFTVGLGDADRVYQNGFLLSELYPFIGIAGLHYCFVNHNISYYLIKILIRIIKQAKPEVSITETVDQLVNYVASELLGPNNGQYYHYDGQSVSVLVLPIAYKDYFVKPTKFRSNRDETADALSSGSDTVYTLLIDFEGNDGLQMLKPKEYRLSLAYLLQVISSEELKQNFYKTIFGQIQNEELSDDDSALDEVFDEDDENKETDIDDLSEDSTTDEYEYDDLDDDKKAEALASQYDEEDKLPEEYHIEKKVLTSEEADKLSYQYQLPTELLERQDAEMETVAKTFEDSFEEDQFETPDEELQSEKESEDIMGENDPSSSYDDLFDDDEEFKPETPTIENEDTELSDAPDMYDYEYVTNDGSLTYQPPVLEEATEEEEEDDEDQLSLFDEEGNIAPEVLQEETSPAPEPFLFMPGIKKKSTDRKSVV